MENQFLSKYAGKRIGFVGIGVSNLPTLTLFAKNGFDVVLRDRKTELESEQKALLENLNITTILGDNYLNNIDEDYLFLAPVLRPDVPALVEAASRGTVLTTEMQEFFELCPCPITAVTGSDGKTTTTTLISLILKASGKKVFLGGNIGENLFVTLDRIKKDDCAVVELSSFQLMKMNASPDVAVITNVSPNHLDWHKDMSEYSEAKARIFAAQNKDSLLVVNYDNPTTRGFAERANGRVRFFSHGQPQGNSGVWFDERGIFYNDTLITADGELILPGRHNRENFAAAVAATVDAVNTNVYRQIATTFKGVEHRLELIDNIDGVNYYNSSIDSSPTRTAAALNSFKDKVIVICGGYDKKIPLEPLGELFERKAKAAIIMGNTADKIQKILEDRGFKPVYRVSTMADAVKKASEIAEVGDKVVLSPAAASFDMFKNFAERGQVFKREVIKLKG